MSDTGAVDAAIVSRLQADSQLLALMPDGVWINEAPAGKRAFVIVSLAIGQDVGQMAPLPAKRRAMEDLRYLIKAVNMNASRTPARNAAARIDAVMEDPAALTVPGYGVLQCHRFEAVEDTEPDQIDQTIRWQHYGGRYRVLVTPLNT